MLRDNGRRRLLDMEKSPGHNGELAGCVWVVPFHGTAQEKLTR